jgi:hypothetical protein
MSKKVFVVVAVLSVFFSFSNYVFCKESKIQSVFLSINDDVIKPDETKPVPCAYENLLNGRTSGIPDDMYLWLAIHPEGSGGYWPQNVAIVPHPKNGKWSVKFWLGTRGTDIGKKFELWLVLVNKSGNQFYTDYLKKAKKTKKYPEIPLPEGYKALDMITLIKSKN